MNVVGIALNYRPHMVAGFVYAFRPGTVPITTNHEDGRLLGWVDEIESWQGRDILWRGRVADDPSLVARLRSGHATSVEAVEMGDTTVSVDRAAAGAAFVASKHHWRGVLHSGWNLIGIALSDRPASPGSAIWSIE